MRSLYLNFDQESAVNVHRLLSFRSTRGVLVPNLELLEWDTSTALLGLLHLFLSPCLRHVTFCPHLPHGPSRVSPGHFAPLVQMISSLPSLEHLSVLYDNGKEESFQNAVFSFICRFGSSLKSFETRMPLSEAAILLLATLPNLSSWGTPQAPPQSFPKPIFPSLKKLRLFKPEALQWLERLPSGENGMLQNDSGLAIQSTNTTEMLEFIQCPGNPTINSELLSSITKFRNLVTLVVDVRCCWGGRGECDFRLTDDDMENLATTLTRLKFLWLGAPCRYETCKNTVASLMSISVHCLDLESLETHFITRGIAGDMQRLLDEAAWHGKPKCKVQELRTTELLLDASEAPEGWETIKRGYKLIFPHLRNL